MTPRRSGPMPLALRRSHQAGARQTCPPQDTPPNPAGFRVGDKTIWGPAGPGGGRTPPRPPPAPVTGPPPPRFVRARPPPVRRGGTDVTCGRGRRRTRQCRSHRPSARTAVTSTAPAVAAKREVSGPRHQDKCRSGPVRERRSSAFFGSGAGLVKHWSNVTKTIRIRAKSLGRPDWESERGVVELLGDGVERVGRMAQQCFDCVLWGEAGGSQPFGDSAVPRLE